MSTKKQQAFLYQSLRSIPTPANIRKQTLIVTLYTPNGPYTIFYPLLKQYLGQKAELIWRFLDSPTIHDMMKIYEIRNREILPRIRNSDRFLSGMEIEAALLEGMKYEDSNIRFLYKWYHRDYLPTIAKTEAVLNERCWKRRSKKHLKIACI